MRRPIVGGGAKDLVRLIFFNRTSREMLRSYRHMQTKIFRGMSTTDEQYLNKHPTNMLILKILFKDNYVNGWINYLTIVCGMYLVILCKNEYVQ
jgi:hypothetical protein